MTEEKFAEITVAIWRTRQEMTGLDEKILADHAATEIVAREAGFTNSSLEAWQKCANEIIRPGLQRHLAALCAQLADTGAERDPMEDLLKQPEFVRRHAPEERL
jgi:hypothetical protein